MSTIILRALLVLMVFVAVVNAGRRKNKRTHLKVFQRRHPLGPRRITSRADAEEVCGEGNRLAKRNEILNAVKKKNFNACGCGYLKRGQVRPRCGPTPGAPYIVNCANNPSQEDGYEHGYDVYCYGRSGPELPPDAVPINYKGHNGYVHIVRKGDGYPIKDDGEARTICVKQGAKIARPGQVVVAWYNGLSHCNCAWSRFYSSMASRANLTSCHNTIGVIPCNKQDIYHVFCYTSFEAPPNGINLVNFTEIRTGTYPRGGVEEGAVQIRGGYVYPSIGDRGYMRTPTLFTAHHVCRKQGATVATTEQLREARQMGMHHCECGWVWENAYLKLGVVVVGEGAVMYPSQIADGGKCAQPGLVSCPLKNPDGDGWNVLCYKACPDRCPPEESFNIPPNSVPIIGGRVYSVEHEGKYNIESKERGAQKCGHTNGQLASLQQLRDAKENGLTRCQCGYIADGSVVFPMYRHIASCGNKTGILTCPGDYQDIPEQGPKWDAWCFISDEQLARVRV